MHTASHATAVCIRVCSRPLVFFSKWKQGSLGHDSACWLRFDTILTMCRCSCEISGLKRRDSPALEATRLPGSDAFWITFLRHGYGSECERQRAHSNEASCGGIPCRHLSYGTLPSFANPRAVLQTHMQTAVSGGRLKRADRACGAAETAKHDAPERAAERTKLLLETRFPVPARRSVCSNYPMTSHAGGSTSGSWLARRMNAR
jgi:hypothetical protein